MKTLILAAAVLLCSVNLHAQNQTILSENIKITVENEVSMNSKNSEFGVNEFMGKFCFTTNRNQFDRRNKFLGEAAYNLMTFDDKKNYRKVYPFEAVKGKTNVGSVSQVINGRFYFTAENNKADYNLKEATMTRSMIIYEAVWTKGKWKVNPLKIIKDKHYSYIHHTISKDGKTMYFASDIPGGFGGMDLYVSHLTEKGWSEPENLGENINTAENELFPFIHSSGRLVFSSNGHQGFGGMDLYVTIKTNDDWISPENMGSPINTPANDFSMYVNSDFTEGYFSSNREGGMGSDDIYYLAIDETFAEHKSETINTMENTDVVAVSSTEIQAVSVLEETTVSTK